MSFSFTGFGRLATAGRIFLIFGLVLSLFLVASATFTYTRPASAYATSNPTPAYAAVDPVYASPWPGEGVWDNIRNRLSGLWSKITCATDVACWVRQATTSALNYGIYTLSGTDVLEIAEASTPAEAFADGYGLVGGTAMAIGGIYENPPNIHFASFFKKEFSENLLTSPTYATFGTELLSPIQTTWTKMREIAYALFVVIMMAIALMIMLRKQVETRVVVTVTHALPKMFMALVLITLSYPIAALFIDLFIVWLPHIIWDALNPGEVLMPPGTPLPGGEQPLVFTFGFGGISFILGALKVAMEEGPGPALGTLAALFFILLILIAGFLVFGLVVLQLLYRYARILIATIFSPLLLLLGALPGQEGVISGWFKDLAVNTLVFPGILTVAIVAFRILAETSYRAAFERVTEIPGIGQILLTTGPIPSLTGCVICLIVLLTSFKVPGLIEKAIAGKGRR